MKKVFFCFNIFWLIIVFYFTFAWGVFVEFEIFDLTFVLFIVTPILNILFLKNFRIKSNVILLLNILVIFLEIYIINWGGGYLNLIERVVKKGIYQDLYFTVINHIGPIAMFWYLYFKKEKNN